MKRKDFFLFFLIPFAGIFIIFFVFSSINRAFIQRTVEGLIQEQLQATAEILRVNISHFLEEGIAPEMIIKRYADEENIYYMALLDRDNRIISWSSRYEGYLPFSARDASQKEPWIISSPAGKIFNLLTPVPLDNEAPYVLYLGYSLGSLEKMAARSKRNFLFAFAFLASVGIVFFIGIFGLQRKYLEKKKEAEEEKKEKERFKEISALTSAVAHEIKNPLNSLALLCELLHKKGPAEVKEDAALGKEEVHRISRVIDQFSDALRPLRLKKEKVYLRDLIESARRAIQLDPEKSVVLLRYKEDRPVVLEADKDLLARAFFNLLRNAFEATESGSVSVTAERRRKKVTIRVEDTGRGIAPENIGRLFDPFFTTKETGLGIGLYLARKIVEAHEGKIEVESKLGQGTVFIIQLPGGPYE
ncbi:MAG: HAMP domain-containing sensor histidine kinase [Clostridiales bacterium]|nr:HAMP domain-containing sensor histidine kinase [Clostridiales bacterium]